MTSTAISANDFSFPTFDNPVPCLEFSSSVWRIPSDLSHEDYTEGGCDKSSVADEEDKMDKLWENFNEEELRRTLSLGRKKSLEKSLEFEDMPRCNSSVFFIKKPSLLFINRILRKLFLLSRSRY